MDVAARQYARKILLIHLAVLLVVIAVVAGAAREVYQQARRQSLEQAQKRQELLAWQAARGIENYYGSIIDNLDLIQRGDEKEENRFLRMWMGRTAFAMAPVLWHQLEGRVSHMFGIVRQGNKVVAVFPRDKTKEAEEAAKVALPALQKVERITVLPLQKIGDEWAHMVCVPTVGGQGPIPNFGPGGGPGGPGGGAIFPPAEGMGERPRGGGGGAGGRGPTTRPMRDANRDRDRDPRGNRPADTVESGDGRMLLVAVVPASGVEGRFLSNVRKDGLLGARFVDEDGTSIASSRGEPAGVSLIDDTEDKRLASVIARHVPAGKRGSELIADTVRGNRGVIEPRMVSIEPVKVADQTWAVVISSPLAEVDALVNGLFGRALFWAGFVVVAVTATLLSTATHMIRGRLRMERMQNQMLNKELSQARQIQLAWLPDGKSRIASVDLAAVNKPASHISGDFYDWFELTDGRTVVTIGDVTGHGMGAAFLMATAQLLIRTTMPRVKDPGRCLGDVNRQLCTQMFNGQFVTALILVIDPEERTVEVASAGHYPPLLGDGSGATRSLEMEGELVLGVDADSSYTTSRFELPDDYSLLLYTDGVIDARSIDGERFRLDRLLEAAQGHAGSAQELVQAVVESVVEFQGTAAMSDDLTLVAIHAAGVVKKPAKARRAAAIVG